MENSSTISLQSSLPAALQSSFASSWPSLLLDSLLLFLLLCAVIYAVRLSRAVHSIHRGKAELAWLFARFAESIAKAEGLLEDLKRAALEAQERHEQSKEKAKHLQSDLTYLIEKGNSLADQLEVTMSSSSKNSGKAYGKQNYAIRKQSKLAGSDEHHNKASALNKAPDEDGARNLGDNSASLPSLQNLR